MNKTKTIVTVVVIILIAGAGWYYTKNKTVPAPTGEPIKIGVITPLTGKFSNLGEDFRNGVDLAVKKVNQQQQLVTVIYEDSASDPKIGLSAFNKLTNVDKVSLVLNGPGSSISLAIGPKAQESGVPFIAQIKAAGLDQTGNHVFRFSPLIDPEVTKINNYFLSRNYKKIALIYDASSDSIKSGADQMTTKFATNDRILIKEGFTPTSQNYDFRTTLTKLLDSKPEAIYILATDKHASAIIKQLREQNKTLPIFGWSTFESNEILQTGPLAEGIIFTAEPLDCNAGQARDYCQSYQETFTNHYPQYYGGYAYDTLMIINDLISKHGDDIAAIETSLANLNYNGVMGPIKIDNNGNMKKDDYVLKTIKDGKFVKLEK